MVRKGFNIYFSTLIDKAGNFFVLMVLKQIAGLINGMGWNMEQTAYRKAAWQEVPGFALKQ